MVTIEHMAIFVVKSIGIKVNGQVKDLSVKLTPSDDTVRTDRWLGVRVRSQSSVSRLSTCALDSHWSTLTGKHTSQIYYHAFKIIEHINVIIVSITS